MTPTPDLRDRFRGCLLGGAMGDALGYPVEFVGTADIVRRFGSSPPARLTYACTNGESVAIVSDDTQMTLFTAEGLIRAWRRGSEKKICHPPAMLAMAYRRWYRTQYGDGPPADCDDGWLLQERGLWARRAPGSTCLSALKRLEAGAELPDVDHPPNDSKGCGAVMRTAPIGLGLRRREEAFALGRDSSVVTHGHPSGYLSAAYFSALIWDLARGEALDAATAHADALLRDERGHEELRAILDRTRALARQGPPDATTIEQLGGGWTGEEALAIALLCALTAGAATPENTQAALWRAAAHSGDSDSTAAICGNLLGALGGATTLPPAWLAELEMSDVIERLAEDLCAVLIDEETRPTEQYPPW